MSTELDTWLIDLQFLSLFGLTRRFANFPSPSSVCEIRRRADLERLYRRLGW
jgi:hypothetical protein